MVFRLLSLTTSRHDRSLIEGERLQSAENDKHIRGKQPGPWKDSVRHKGPRGRTRWRYMPNLTMMASFWLEVNLGKILDTNDILITRGSRNNERWGACSCFCRGLSQQ